MKDLRQVTIIGMGLLGGSIALAVLRALSGVRVVGFSHRASTRRKARELLVTGEVVDDIKESVSSADLVILATPIRTFEGIFDEIAEFLPSGCIVTDVGSTKVLPGRWAARKLPKEVRYVGSHPIAGSEQRGVEFARDDLFYRAMCILTVTDKANRQAVRTLDEFWSALGCVIKRMTPEEHDAVFANVSHLPHAVAASLINANSSDDLRFSGMGFIDTSRVASGPSNIWADILVTNSSNVTKAIDRMIQELEKLRQAVKAEDTEKITKLLDGAREKRRKLINLKMKKKELLL